MDLQVQLKFPEVGSPFPCGYQATALEGRAARQGHLGGRIHRTQVRKKDLRTKRIRPGFLILGGRQLGPTDTQGSASWGKWSGLNS